MENNEAELTYCMVCKEATDEDLLVYCDGCDNAYHTYCMSGCECCKKVPNRQFKKVMEVPEGDWFCKHCKDHVPALEEGAAPKTIMYGWGDNTSGCLGSGIEKKLISTVTELSEVKGTEIKEFGVGYEVSVMVDSTGAVYTCGNGTSGVLGHQDVVHECLDKLRRVDFFQSGKISKGEGIVTNVYCRADNILASTLNGHLYGWGENTQGELGHMDYKVKRLPKKNSVGYDVFYQAQAFRELNVQVKKIAMGDHHTLVLGDDNAVYAMGENTQRQLGVSNNSLEWTPKRLCQEWKHDRTVIEEPDFPGPVTRIFAGGNSSVCIDKKGFVYMWGNDILNLSEKQAEGSVSFVSKRTFIPYPMKVEIFNDIEIKDIVFGLSHMMVLDVNGVVYVAGDNTKGQLGLDKSNSFVGELTKLESVPGAVEGIFALNNLSGCYGPFGLYLWGESNHNVMKVFASEENLFAPQRVEGITNVEKVHLSDTHIIVKCATSENSRKRDAPAEEEAKKAKVEQ